jgi:hypothetical protein
MRVRCRATADYRSNAVGSIELECVPDGLRFTLRGVSSYREGYAPGPPVHTSAAATVPWAAVYATRIGDESLLLSVDARYLPQNRLLLAHFADPPPDVPPGLSPGRRLLIGGSIGAGLLALAVVLGLTEALPQPHALGNFALAAVLAALVMAILVLRSRLAPRRSSAQVLSDLSLELAQHLPNHIAVEVPTPAPRSFERLDLSAFLPRSAVGIAVTLAATTLAALVGSSAARPTASDDGPAANAAALRPGPGDLDARKARAADAAESAAAFEPARLQTPGSIAPSAPLPSPLIGEPCECQREAALLWRRPLPRLAPLIIAQEIRMHEGHRHTELELGVVNDGSVDAERISLSVLFFEERTGTQAGQWQTGERTLSFEGPLAPGRLVKWHVEGRGTSFDIVAPDSGTLALDGSDAAPADAFAALASEGARAVRLHAARLLTFLGDERARGAALASSPPTSTPELGYLERIATASRDVVACRVAISAEGSNRWRLDACLYNRTAEPRRDLDLRLLALEDTRETTPSGAGLPGVLAEHTAHLDVTLAPRSGRTVALSVPLPLETKAEPRAFEVVVDREENLP